MPNNKDILKKHLKYRTRLPVIKDSGIFNLDYDQNLYPFAESFKKILIEKNLIHSDLLLEDIHSFLDKKDKAVDIFGFNQMTRLTYDTSAEFTNLYMRFMQEIIIPFIGKDCYAQKTPTNRFSFPFAEGVNTRFYHSDIMLGHPPTEINIWLPFTKTLSTQSFKVLPLSLSLELLEVYNYDLEELESKIKSDNSVYSLIEKNSFYVDLLPGQCLIFDSRCLHAVKLNKSEKTRISMDARIIIKEDYDNLPYKFMGNKGTRKRSEFIPGDYYAKSLITI